MIALLGLVGYAVVGTLCFVVPHQDPLPRHADVAMVLGPPTDARQAVALDLLRRGTVGAVLFSVTGDDRDRGGWNSRALQRCATVASAICATADPATTQGEGRLLRQESERHRWRSAVVITQPAHALRSGSIVRHCYRGRVVVRTSAEPPIGGWPYEFAYQTAATVKEWLTPSGC